jgi:hypothetical protein
MVFSAAGLLVMNDQPTAYIGYCSPSVLLFETLTFKWVAFFGTPISCNTSQRYMALPSAFILGFKSMSAGVTEMP